MEWRIATACAVGTSHLLQKKNCQDYCFAAKYPGVDGNDYLVAFTADGAGGTVFGGEGAKIACQYARSLVEQWLSEDPISSLDECLVHTWAESIRLQLLSYAASADRDAKEFSSTFLGVVIGPSVAAFVQIGDGGIVTGCGGKYDIIFWPDNGEYVNETYFLTDPDAGCHIRIKISPEFPDEVALFSDGLQRLVLDYMTRQVHSPFFKSMFEVLKILFLKPGHNCNSKLADFLNSKAVNERTDDDKTLVLATRRLI